MIDQNFIILGFFIQIAGGLGYCLDTLRGKIQPNRVSWFLWFLAPMIAFFAQLNKGVGLQSLLTFSVGFIPLLVLIASFLNKKAVWKIGLLDIICGFLSLIGIVLWWITSEGNLAIVFSIAADVLAGIPTVVKSYTHPQSENPYVYLSVIISSILTILTIKTFDFANSAFAYYIFFIDCLLFFLIKSRIGLKLSKNR